MLAADVLGDLWMLFLSVEGSDAEVFDPASDLL